MLIFALPPDALSSAVIPAGAKRRAGIEEPLLWMPAFAGKTTKKRMGGAHP
jgi:hypothetical protein